MFLIGKILFVFLNVMMYIMLARAIMSWFVRDLSNPIARFLYDVTEPLINPIRNIMNSLGFGNSMIDFSFIIAYLILIILQEIVRAIFFAGIY